MKCRHCSTDLTNVFLDLGFAPPSNAYLTAGALTMPETYYPLKLYTCTSCFLVQTADYAAADILFDADYAYFSSTSSGWLKHAADYCAQMSAELGLTKNSFVIEVASNDGYLLKNFVANGIPCLGIEPTASTAAAAEKIGIPVLREFFGEQLAKQLAADGTMADLILGNNVYAHVPDINDFTIGLRTMLKPGGTVTIEFPHLLQLMANNQFDTVYHEHFSYLSLQTVQRIFSAAGLRLYHVEELGTHGGSLRVYGCHETDPRGEDPSMERILQAERAAGLDRIETYLSFQGKADKVKNDFLNFLLEQKRTGKSVAGYGAAAKGNTLMNYAGVKPDLVSFVCDAALAKQGKYLPGSHIPILPPAALAERKPDWVVIFPWNIAAEVMQQQAVVRSWGGKFVAAVPELSFYE